MIRSNVKSSNGFQYQQVRFLKRRLAYPENYVPIVPKPTSKKDHSSYFQRAFKEWLGPKNMRGEYFRNVYYYPPQDHTPKYIVPNGRTVEGANQVEYSRSLNSKRDPSLHPFPENLECKTALMISNELKTSIYEDATTNGLKLQEIAHKYGIKLERVEAIVRLYSIEQDWKQKVCTNNYNFLQMV